MSKQDLRTTHGYSKELGFINKKEGVLLCEIAFRVGQVMATSHTYLEKDVDDMYRLYEFMYGNFLASPCDHLGQFMDSVDIFYIEQFFLWH